MVARVEANKKRKDMYHEQRHIGRNLRLLRHLHNISQDTIAAHLNISRSAYRYIEAGERIPTLEMICEISKFYDISLDYLVAFDISEHILSIIKIRTGGSESMAFMEKYLELSYGAKEQVRNRITELLDNECYFNNFPWKYSKK